MESWFDSPDAESRCGFPGCIGRAFHGGEHEFPPAPVPAPRGPIYTCRECGGRFVIYGQHFEIERHTCGSPACILALSRRQTVSLPVVCRCPQRPWPHEISVHAQLRYEGPRTRWPWTLARSIAELGRETS